MGGGGWHLENIRVVFAFKNKHRIVVTDLDNHSYLSASLHTLPLPIPKVSAKRKKKKKSQVRPCFQRKVSPILSLPAATLFPAHLKLRKQRTELDGGEGRGAEM